jgi:hypothetical protein
MNRNWKRRALILGGCALVACTLALQPLAAAKKNVVVGEIVSFDPDANLLVVKDSNGGGEITLHTSKRTSVVGLRQGPEHDDVSVLVGMQGSTVTVKFKDNGKGKEASYIRIKPKRA